MDPGQSHLEQLKVVPNLVEEDPSIITPSQQKSYMSMPWKELSAIMQKNKESAEAIARMHNEHEQQQQEQQQQQRQQQRHSSSSSGQVSNKMTSPDKVHPRSQPAVVEGEPEANWDCETGYQDRRFAPLNE